MRYSNRFRYQIPLFVAICMLLTIIQCTDNQQPSPYNFPTNTPLQISLSKQSKQQYNYYRYYSKWKLTTSSSSDLNSYLIIQVQPSTNDGVDTGLLSQLSMNITKLQNNANNNDHIAVQTVSYCKSVKYLACVVDIRQFNSNNNQQHNNIFGMQITSEVAGQYSILSYYTQIQEISTINNKENIKIDMSDHISKHFFIQYANNSTINNSIEIVLTPSGMSTSANRVFCHMSAKIHLSSLSSIQSLNLWDNAQGLYISHRDYVQLNKYSTPAIQTNTGTNNNNRIIISIIGDQYEIYDIKYTINTKQHYDINTIPYSSHQFVDAHADKKYHIKLNGINSSAQLVMVFQMFSGNPQIQFYYKQDYKHAIKSKYFQYMADTKFTFTAEQLANRTKLYLKIRSNYHKTILKMSIKTIVQQQVQKLQQNTYNFYSIDKSKQQKFLYIPVDSTMVPLQQDTLKVTVSVMNIFGSSSMQFMLGNINNMGCLPGCLNNHFSKIDHKVQLNILALKTIYNIDIQKKLLSSSISTLQQSANNVLLIRISKKHKLIARSKTVAHQLTLQYNIQGKTTDLRQNYALTELVYMGQTKYYRFVPLQQTKLLKICVFEISGSVGIMGSYTNFHNKNATQITAHKGCIQFTSFYTVKARQPVYIKVYGIQKSKYSVNVQVAHKQQIVVTPKIQTNQDVDYKVTIQPLASYIFILHPLYAHIRISYNSTHPMRICLLQNKDRKDDSINLGEPVKQQIQNLGCNPDYTRNNELAGQFYNQLSQPHAIKMQITNPSLNNRLQFRLKYHSGDYEHCQLKLTNKIYEQDVTANICYQYEIDMKEIDKDYQFIMKRFTYFGIRVNIVLCEKEKLVFYNKNIMDISKWQLQSQCNSTSNDTLNMNSKKQALIQIIVQFPQNSTVAHKLQYILQQKPSFSSSNQLEIQNNIIYLPLNVRYADYLSLPQQQDKASLLRGYILGSQIISNFVVQIRLYSSISFKRKISISIYLIDKLAISNRFDYRNMNPFVTKQINTKNSSSAQVDIVVMQIQAKKQCYSVAKQQFIQQCQLLVVIQQQSAPYLMPTLNQNTSKISQKYSSKQLEYSIQFKSASNILKQYQPETSHLQQIGSSDIYTFYPSLSQPQNGNFIGSLQVSTHNNQCTKIYIKRFQQNNNKIDDHDQKNIKNNRQEPVVVSTQSLNFFNIDANAFIIQIQAIKASCQYSVEVAMIQNEIMSPSAYQTMNTHANSQGRRNKKVQILYSGVPRDFKMSKNQLAYYVVQGVTGQDWKILFLRKTGDIRLYAAKWTDVIQKKVFNSNYKFSQLDFPISQKFPNTLQLQSSSQINSHQAYLIAINSESQAVGSLLLQSLNQPIKLPAFKKVLFSLKPSQPDLTLNFLTPQSFTIKSGHLHVQLIYGKIQIKASFVQKNSENDNKVIRHMLNIADNECCKVGKDNLIQFDFNKVTKSVQFLQIKIEAQGIQQAIFQVNVQLNANQITIQDIDKDVLNHIQISKQQKTMLNIKIDGKTLQLFVAIVEHHSPSISLLNGVNNKQNMKIQPSSQNKPNNNLKQHKTLDQYKKSPPLPSISTAQVNQVKTLLNCLRYTIPQLQKQSFIIKNVSAVMDNVHILTIEWTKFSFTHPSTSVTLQISLSDQCYVNQTMISVTPSMFGRVTILKPWQWAYFRNKRSFAFASKNDFLIDIISCSGSPSVKIAKSLHQIRVLSNKNTSNTQQKQKDNSIALPNQPHVLRVKPVQSISYMLIQAPQTTIRLIQPNMQKQQGIGYLKYSWGYFLYETDFQKLSIMLQPLKNISETKTKIESQQYVVRIIASGSDNTDVLLKKSAQCLNLDHNHKVVFQKVFKIIENKIPQIYVGKQDMLKQLNGHAQNLYISVDLVVVLQIPDGTKEVYKFLAPTQQLPVQIFNITKLSNKIIAFGIFIILSVIFGCMILAQVFIKYVVPFLARLRSFRSNNLVQQEVDKQKSQKLPASSDRNQRVTTQLNSERAAATGTQQKMSVQAQLQK